MKLWQKISLLCATVFLMIVGACSTLLILNARDSMLSLTIDSTRKEFDTLQTSFTGMVSYYGRDDADPIVKRSLIRYCFSQFASNTAVLISDDETLYSNLVFDPEAVLPREELDGYSYYIGMVQGRHVLVVGANITFLSGNYTIYDVRDISDVYQNITDMIWKFGAISIAGILAGVLLIVFLVRYAIRPLKSLGKTAAVIAQGGYGERAAVPAKDEIGELAEDFNVMAQAVQQHIEEQREIMERQRLFIGAVTHEFKTPLTSVIGHAETLMYTRMPADVAANSLSHIHEQCRWLERLTQKLLKLITLTEEIDPKEESVTALIAAAAESVRETLAQRGLELVTSCEADTLPMDFDLMQSLLVNLIDNAAKASSPGQTIGIRAYGRTLEVFDHGIGIPQSELTHITEPFYMVDKSRSKKQGGSGLGLALVKRIAEAHGARIEIESKPGAGTVIRVIFPDNI